MTYFNKEAWQKAISDVIELFGYGGTVTIESSTESEEYLIYHPAFGCPFTGFFPKTDEQFTVLTSDHIVRDPSEDFNRTYKEAFVFDAYSMKPIFYSIYREPEYQRIMISSLRKFRCGDIVYANNCIRGGYKQYTLVEPIFESEVFDIRKVIENIQNRR